MTGLRRARRTHSHRRRRTLPVALLAFVAALGAGGGLRTGAPQGAAADPGTTSSCPASNAPNELTLVSGTPQTSKLDSPFSATFQVTLANSNGCPVTISVAGTAVTFAAPSSGAGGTFSASGSNSVTVGVDATGSAAAPPSPPTTSPAATRSARAPRTGP